MQALKTRDAALFEAMASEAKRQSEHIELIASENFVSQAVMDAQGSVLTNKYAEGYPGKRYYGGCAHVDVVETLAIERAKSLYGAFFANVQAHSGSQANMAAFRALIHPGDTVLGMSLSEGGHLTHGHPLNFSGMDYTIVAYGVDETTHRIDYDDVLKKARACKPKLIIAGASAYPRQIDFKRFRDIADDVGAYLLVDMAHIAGLVAAGLHQNPVPYADIVTSTTHKTLRGPRGGLILSQDASIATKIDKMVFPGLQGGPLMHVIAAKATAFHEALQPEFTTYQSRVIENAKALSEALEAFGYHIISGGTDNHLVLVDVKKTIGMTGKKAEKILESVNITCNKNTVPNDPEKPFVTSGIRLGTPAVTTRGLGKEEMVMIAEWIDRALRFADDQDVLDGIKNEVIALMRPFPTVW